MLLDVTTPGYALYLISLHIFAGICSNTCLLVYTLDEIYGLAIIVTGLGNCKIDSRPVMVMAIFTISYLTSRAVLDYLGTSIKIRH